jgi:hypothetical protein
MCFVFKAIHIFSREKIIVLGQREKKLFKSENGPDFDNSTWHT